MCYSSIYNMIIYVLWKVYIEVFAKVTVLGLTFH